MDAMDAEMVAMEDVESTQTDVDAVDAEMAATETTVGTTAIVRHFAMASGKATRKVFEMVSRPEMTMTDSRSRAEVQEVRAVRAVREDRVVQEDRVVDVVETMDVADAVEIDT